jgi:hypothetical protein
MWDRDRVKEQMTKIIAEQPDGSTNDKVLRELAFASMVEQGLKDSENNNTISNGNNQNFLRSFRNAHKSLKNSIMNS